MDKKPIIAGEIPRLKIEMSPIGNYHLANIEWSVEFSASRGKVIITKQNAEMLTEDSYAVRVDTTNIGTGKLYGILYPSIPDPDVGGRHIHSSSAIRHRRDCSTKELPPWHVLLLMSSARAWMLLSRL